MADGVAWVVVDDDPTTRYLPVIFLQYPQNLRKQA